MVSFLHPRLVVQDPDAAVDFYRRALGARLESRSVERDVVVNAALSVGDFSVTLVAETREWGLLSPRTLGGSASLITLGVDDARATAAKMVAEGAEVVVPVEDRPYGRCEGRIRDPFGHLWIPTHELGEQHSPGVQRIVPDLRSADLAESTDFYQRVLGLDVAMDLGWVTAMTPPLRLHPQLIIMAGDRTAVADPDVSIEVIDLDFAWKRAVELGAEIVHPRTVEEWGVERFFVRDPGGNVVNILAHRAEDD